MAIKGTINIMITILTTLTSTSFLKSYFLAILGVNTVAVIDQAVEKGFYEALVNNIPAQILTILGIIAGVIWILRLADNAWHNHLLNKSKSKIEDEKAEQEEIETDKKRKNFKDDTNN